MRERQKNIGLAVTTILTTLGLILANNEISKKTDSDYFEVPFKINGKSGICYSTGEFIPEDKNSFPRELMKTALQACGDFVTRIRDKTYLVVECGSWPQKSRLDGDNYYGCLRLSAALRRISDSSAN